MNLIKKLVDLEEEAAEFGFLWENTEQIIQQIQSECIEVQEHLPLKAENKTELQDELGDLLHAVFSLCVFCKLDPEQTLDNTIAKFEKRLRMVKQIAGEKEMVNVKGQSFDDLMELWAEAKERTKGASI